MKIKLILCLLCCLIFAVKTFAAQEQLAFTSPEKVDVLSKEGKNILDKIEQYLNSITTIKADFIQSASNGSYSAGNLYLNRPGKMRIDYQPPMNVEIVADGRFLIYHDIPLEQVTYINLASSPAGILLKNNMSFADDSITIKNITKFTNAFEVTVVHKDNETSEITLVFADKPLELKQWRIHDAHNIITAISLYNVKTKVELDDKLFKFVDPRRPNPYADKTNR